MLYFHLVEWKGNSNIEVQSRNITIVKGYMAYLCIMLLILVMLLQLFLILVAYCILYKY